MSKNEVVLKTDFEIPDLNLPSVLDIRDSVLDLEGVPDQACMILSLSAMGFNMPRIAKMLGITKQSVEGYLNRYDPERKCRLSSQDKRAITTQMMHSTAIEALMNITHEKMKESTAKELSAIASQCAATMEKMNLSKQVGEAISTSRVHSMLDALDVGEE